MDRMPISGVRLSGPLVLMRVFSLQGVSNTMPALFRMLTDLAVNIAFMAYSGLEEQHLAICCIDPSTQSRVETGLAGNADLRASVGIEPGEVGLLSIYPHQASLSILGSATQVLTRNGACIYALASSISALTYVIDYMHLQQAAAIFSDTMMLPPEAETAPLKTTF